MHHAIMRDHGHRGGGGRVSTRVSMPNQTTSLLLDAPIFAYRTWSPWNHFWRRRAICRTRRCSRQGGGWCNRTSALRWGQRGWKRQRERERPWRSFFPLPWDPLTRFTRGAGNTHKLRRECLSRLSVLVSFHHVFRASPTGSRERQYGAIWRQGA